MANQIHEELEKLADHFILHSVGICHICDWNTWSNGSLILRCVFLVTLLVLVGKKKHQLGLVIAGHIPPRKKQRNAIVHPQSNGELLSSVILIPLCYHSNYSMNQ